jgi:methylated-DNA-[protein]-cysteine S-methyltransferase
MLPSVHVAVVDAPWGEVMVAAWDRGLVACESTVPFEPFVERLGRRLRAEVLEIRHPVLDQAVAQLEDFAADRRRDFDLPIDLSDRPAWDQAVLGAVCDVPWGTVASYGQIARAVDRPGAARATGGAVARSPIGIVVPCHRIIAADGTLGGYGVDGFGSRLDHLRLKRELLLREGIDIPLPAP